MPKQTISSPGFEYSTEYQEFLRWIGVGSTAIYGTNVNSAARAIGRKLKVADLSSELAVCRTMRLISKDAVADASRKSIHCALRKYAAMVETNYNCLFHSGPVRPAHLPEFEQWLLEYGKKKWATARLYSRLLSYCAEHHSIIIHERTLAYEPHVNHIVSQLNRLAEQREARGDETFMTHDAANNLKPALHAYVKFVKSEFPERGEPIMRANDVPTGDLPKRVRQEISRLVRDNTLAQEVKVAHSYTCQLCGHRLQLSPGEFYAEGHHLKPLGQPHNGDDKKENIICVCPNCHVLLDYNAVRLTPGKLTLRPGHTVAQEFIDYHNARCP